MVDITWSRPEIPRNGARHPAFPRSARRPTRKSQKSKSYERTRQPIENKGQEISNPINLLKAGSLAPLPRQDIENTHVTSKRRAIKNLNPVNSLKLNRVSCVDPVNSLKIQALTQRGGKPCQDRL
jgi:hypothetical protein